MREHRYRGKRVDNGEWVYGYYNGCYETATIDYLKNGIPWNVCVIPETVGEYTEKQDKNGVDSYESDILDTPIGKAVIMFGEFCGEHVGFYLKFASEEDGKYYRNDLGYWLPKSVICGNIHDTPLND